MTKDQVKFSSNFIKFAHEIITAKITPINKQKQINKTLDDHLMFIAQQNKSDIFGVFKCANETNLIICSTLHLQGGHSKFIYKLIELSNRKNIIVITEATGKVDKKLIDKIKNENNCEVAVLRGNTKVKLEALERLLNEEKYYKTYILNSPNDFIPILAALKCSGQNYIYVHHSDLYPCPGASIKTWKHIDLLKGAYENCHLNVDTKYIPLPRSHKSLSIEPIVKEQRPGRKVVITASYNKLKFIGRRNFYSVIKSLTSSGEIKVVHFGNIPKLLQIVSKLYFKGRQSAYEYHGPLDDMSKIKSKIEPDLALMSFPIPGGMTCVDYQSLGIPIIFFNYQENTNDEVLKLTSGNNLNAHSVKELTEIILNTPKEKLIAIGRQNLKHYENNYSDEIFCKSINKIAPAPVKNIAGSDNTFKIIILIIKQMTLRGILRYIHNLEFRKQN